MGGKPGHPFQGKPNITPENARELNAKSHEARKKKQARLDEWEKVIRGVLTLPDEEFSNEALREHLIKITKGGKLLVTMLVEGLIRGTLTNESVNAIKTLMDRISGRPAPARKPFGADPKGTTVLIQSFDKGTISTPDGKSASVDDPAEEEPEPEPDEPPEEPDDDDGSNQGGAPV